MQNFAVHIKHPVFKVVSEIIAEKQLEAYVVGGFELFIGLVRLVV